MRSILILALASFSQPAFGQIAAWTNTGPDDSFNDGSNWVIASTPAGTVPGSGNLVGIFPGFTASADGAGILIQAGGSPSITISTSTTTLEDHSLSGLFISGTFVPLSSTAVPNATVNLEFNSGSTLTIGTDLEITGGATVNFNGNLTGFGNLTVGEETSTLAAGLISGPGTLNLGAGTVNLDSTTTTFNVGNGQLGTVVQNSGSTVITGENFFVESGSYTVNSGAVLDLGTQGTPGATSYNATIGSGVAAMTVAGGTLNAMNPNSSIIIGAVGNSTFTQSGASSVNVGGNGSGIFLGESGATGTYTLSGGALNIGANNTDSDVLSIGSDAVANSTGIFVQTGGTVVVGTNSIALIGDSGTGSYRISGSNAVTADFRGGLTVGSGGAGTFTQTGGLVTVEGPMIVGDVGNGTYSLTGGELDTNGTFSIGTGGGTGIFTYGGGTLVVSNGITIGATGTFNQDASLSLTNPVTIAAGGAYNLNSGTLATGGTVFTGTGNFNFGGGTVNATSSWTDPLNGTITGTSIITGAGATLNGKLMGTGTLNILGATTVALDNLTGTPSSGSWGATITGGSILTAANVKSLSTNGAIVIGTGSTFNLGSTGAPTDTFAGNISDIHDMAGTANFNTNTTTGAYKLVLSGTVDLDANSLTTIGTGGELEVNNGTISNISGSGGNPGDTFDVGNGTTTGTVILLGNNIIPNVFVNSGSTLFASNISGSVTNRGILGTGTGSTPGTLTIGGNLTQGPTGILDVRVLGTTADLYQINGAGTSTLAGGLTVSGSTALGTHTFLVINAPNGTLNSSALTVTNPSTALFSVAIDSALSTPQTVVIETMQNSIASFATTPNEQAVANSLDNTGTNPIKTVFNQITLGAAPTFFPRALESLTPDNLQYSRIIAFEGATFLVQRINTVDNNLRSGYGGLDTNAISVTSAGFTSGMGRSLTSLLASDSPAFHQTAPNGVNYYPGTGGTSDSGPASLPETSPSTSWEPSSQVISDSSNNPYLANVHPEGPNTPGFSEFISGDVVLANLNQDLSATNAPSSKASYQAANATAGISYRFTSHFSAGVLFDYEHTDAKTDAYGSKTTVDTYTPGLFATYFDHGFYANGLFGFGINQYRNTRDISFLGETATSNPSGEQYTGDLDFGYDFHPDKNWVVGPTLGVTYSHLDIDTIHESGAPGADLTINSQSADSLRSRLGAHVIFQTNTGDVLLQPNITAEWQHEYLDDSAGITSSFSDFNSSPFTIQTTSPSRDSALLGVGLTATLNNSLSLYVNYVADVGADDYFAQSVYGGIKTRF